MKLICFTLFFFFVCGCSNNQTASIELHIPSKADKTKSMETKESDYAPEFKRAHPRAKELMNEEFYFSPIDETGPFGSDDGADTYAGFQAWRKVNPGINPRKFLDEQIYRWNYPLFDFSETRFEVLKPYLKQSDLGSRFLTGIDEAIVAVAFGQLYLEGTVEKETNQLAKTALQRELLPEILALWGDEYKSERETKLKKMLAALNQVE